MTQPDPYDPEAAGSYYRIDHERRFAGIPPDVRPLDHRNFLLLRDASYICPRRRLFIQAKKGFPFDFASVPALFRWTYPPLGVRKNPYGIAAVFHDWLYVVRHAVDMRTHSLVPVSREDADQIFHEIMRYVGVRRTLAWTFLRAVRNFGGIPWRRDAEKDYREHYLLQQAEKRDG